MSIDQAVSSDGKILKTPLVSTGATVPKANLQSKDSNVDGQDNDPFTSELILRLIGFEDVTMMSSPLMMYTAPLNKQVGTLSLVVHFKTVPQNLLVTS